MPITPERTKEIVDRIVEAVHPHRIYLFGSRAKGTAREDSDIDLLIIADMEGPRHKRSLSIHRLFPMRDFGMDVFVFKLEEFERQKVLANSISSIVSKEGKIIYER
jgi:predicted nucleotidyltransferase